jgi:hypothetical protein
MIQEYYIIYFDNKKLDCKKLKIKRDYFDNVFAFSITSSIVPTK